MAVAGAAVRVGRAAVARGRRTWARASPSGLARLYRAEWSRDGSLLALHARGVYDRRVRDYTKSHVDLVRSGRLVRTIDISPRTIGGSPDVPESSGVAPAPGGDAVALLLDHDEVQIRDAATGAVRRTFKAPAPPIPAGLPDEYRKDHRGNVRVDVGGLLWLAPERLLRLAPHFVSFGSPDGKRLGELVVPVRRSKSSSRFSARGCEPSSLSPSGPSNGDVIVIGAPVGPPL